MGYSVMKSRLWTDAAVRTSEAPTPQAAKHDRTTTAVGAPKAATPQAKVIEP